MIVRPRPHNVVEWMPSFARSYAGGSIRNAGKKKAVLEKMPDMRARSLV